MTYFVKELFYTLQGEGAQTGRAAVFCRFSGCNIWSGQEKDRQKTICYFCDTDFVGTDGEGGEKFYSADELSKAIHTAWPVMDQGVPYVIFTGGEPLLQLDSELISQLHHMGFEVGVETNGTIKVPEGVDWICVSPKTLDGLKQISGQEIKLLYPLKHVSPEECDTFDFDYFYLQAIDNSAMKESTDNVQSVVDYCLAHPKWRVSLQTHKILDLK
ncbi:MAG: 7-carboxy-7-deazaguanine synthase [gamma proteobacterium symbiont of Taylorina sp.]|nr:7-carboxy-7-deazaguanine synthase [gamma proteobacterium symbiont of Taylorina sp.]